MAIHAHSSADIPEAIFFSVLQQFQSSVIPQIVRVLSLCHLSVLLVHMGGHNTNQVQFMV